jgi:hypothetical protein
MHRLFQCRKRPRIFRLALDLPLGVTELGNVGLIGPGEALLYQIRVQKGARMAYLAIGPRWAYCSGCFRR